MRVYNEYTESIGRVYDKYYTMSILWVLYNEYYRTCLTAQRSAEKQEYSTNIRKVYVEYTMSIRWLYNEYYTTCLTAQRLAEKQEYTSIQRVYEYTTSIRVYNEYMTSIRQIHDDYTTNIRWVYNEYYKTCLTAHRSAEKQEDSPWLFTCHCTNKHLRQQLRTSFWVLLSSLYLHILQQPFSAWSTWVLLVALYYTAGGTWDILIIDGYFWQKKFQR